MEFFQHLKTYLNDDELKKLQNSLKEKQKYALLLNENKLSKLDFLKLFPNVKQHPIVPNGFIYDKDEYDFGKYIYHEMGVYYLQEPSAMIVSNILNPKENDVILDLCAAPGGKSVQASLLMNDKGVLISNDLSHSRCQALLENVERMGLSNVIITNNDFSKIYKNYLSYFDKIILDAPCSGSGMFRKDDKMIDDWSYSKVLKFASVQKQLIQIAFDMLKPGGEMVYSTCSFSIEEDEEVIQYLLENNEDVEIINIKDDIFYTNKFIPIGVHLMPFKFSGEGHYICKIKKSGEILKQNFKNDKREKYNFNNFVFSLPIDIKLKGLNIIRQGLKMYEIKGKDEIYSHHLSHSSFASAYNAGVCELSINEVEHYIHGESLNKQSNKGFVLLTYKNIPIGYGKSNGQIIKNHYPKYLRNKKIIY